jgi:hypothetical protein
MLNNFEDADGDVVQRWLMGSYVGWTGVEERERKFKDVSWYKG